MKKPEVWQKKRGSRRDSNQNPRGYEQEIGPAQQRTGKHEPPNPKATTTGGRPNGFHDWPRVRRAMELGECSCEPGETLQYHMLSFGWLCAGLVEAVTGCDIKCVASELVAQPLGLNGRLFVGLPDKPDGEVEDSSDPWARCASLSFPMFESMAHEGLGLLRGAGDASIEEELQNRAQEFARPSASNTDMPNIDLSRVKGNEHLLDLRLFNHPKMVGRV